MDIININYISPKSQYVFDNKLNHYYLVFLSKEIHKIILPELTNIDQKLRAISINKRFKTSNQTQSIRVFEHNIKSNMFKLLFVGSIDLLQYDYNNIIKVELYRPSFVLGNFRTGLNVTDEQFFNYETILDKEKCILFMTKLHKANSDFIKPEIINLEKPIFNRYHNTFMKEIEPKKLEDFNDYDSFVKHYNIDINRYSKTNLTTFKELFLRKINPTFRPLVTQVYFNNLINAPCDGRVRAFEINKDLRIKLMDNLYSLNEIIKVPFVLNQGSGLISRLTFADYQRVSMPYSGYLTEINVLPNYTSFKFESTFFMPPSVSERDYASVLVGHHVNDSKEFPELVEPQPKIKLIFYVILFGSQIVVTNDKILRKSDNMWFEIGEEIGGFHFCSGHVLFITNRPTDFTNDIKNYSKKNIECYIKNKDLIGILL